MIQRKLPLKNLANLSVLILIRTGTTGNNCLFLVDFFQKNYR